jgi:hypothetical protein
MIVRQHVDIRALVDALDKSRRAPEIHYRFSNGRIFTKPAEYVSSTETPAGGVTMGGAPVTIGGRPVEW